MKVIIKTINNIAKWKNLKSWKVTKDSNLKKWLNINAIKNVNFKNLFAAWSKLILAVSAEAA